jgi:hypothetical protein
MSSSSPLTKAQKENDKSEAHSNPELVHKKKGKPWQSAANKG